MPTITSKPCLSHWPKIAGLCCRQDWTPSPKAALDLAAGTEDDKLWVIGGGSVYTALLSKCRRVYLTKVDAVAEEADTFLLSCLRIR